MDAEKWLPCPICDSKTKTKIRDDTMLENFPLFCPRCKNETIVTVKKLSISNVIKSDIKTDSQ